ncbi:MAG TPA: HD domain-containing protein [Solirubrobacterales bacterium]
MGVATQPALGERFTRALDLAFELHRGQTRKGSGIPYFGHLLGVTSLVIETGGTEDQAIAALLHDAVEDQGGLPTLERIRAEFGDPVAAIVEECSDSVGDPKPPWRERKEAYLERLESSPEASLHVSLADKLHNIRTILVDYREVGEELWTRFNAGRDEVLWYYRSLAATFARRRAGGLATELAEELAELERLIGKAIAGSANP